MTFILGPPPLSLSTENCMITAALYDMNYDLMMLYNIAVIASSPRPLPLYCRYLDGEFVYSISANALNLTGALIPEEPM